MWEVTADPVEFDEAIHWFRTRLPLTPELEATFGAYAAERAWWVSGVAQLDILLDVWRAIDVAIATGSTIVEFRKAVREKLLAAWGRDIPGRLDTIFRTNVQTAYNRGRWEQLGDPALRKLRPFLMYDAVMDDRTTRICRPLDRTLLPADDPFWETHNPPLHYNCRSSLRSLSKDSAKDRGGAKRPPPVGPGEGEREPPQTTPHGPFGRVDALYRPDLEKYPKPLRDTFEKKIAAVAPPPKPPKEHLPSHWEEHYAERYGDAAKCVAHGRAAFEWAADQKITDVVDGLNKAQSETLKESAGRLKLYAERFPEAKTPRELLAKIKASESTGEDAVSVAVAQHGHRARLALQDPKALRGQVTGKPRDAWGWQRKAFEDGLDFYEDFMARDLKLARGVQKLGISFPKRHVRAYYDPGRHRLVASRSEAVLEHELGHALESANPSRLDRAKAFLAARTKGEALQQLRALTGRTHFRSDERARPDKFIHPYMGKHYEHATEITSMGVELMKREPAKLYREDPEMFFFILGQFANA